MMVKANALYRDGSKLSQPLNSVSEMLHFAEEEKILRGRRKNQLSLRPQKIVFKYISQEENFLPVAQAILKKATVGSHKVYLRNSEYEDGHLGEIFHRYTKEGAAFRSLMNAFAIAVSLGLQHGFLLKNLVEGHLLSSSLSQMDGK